MLRSKVLEIFVVYFVLLLIIRSKCQSGQQTNLQQLPIYCRNGSYNISINDKNITIKWLQSTNGELISEPLCLDVFYNPIKPNCDDIPRWWDNGIINCTYVDNFCPQNFFRKNNSCVNITKASSYYNGCPVPNALDPYESYNSNPREMFWVPTMRIMKDDAFIYYGYNSMYFTYETSNRCPMKTIYNYITFENCNDLHKHVCSYNPNHFLHQCPDNCIPAGLNSTKCYCKKTTACSKLATPTYYYQNVAIRKLAGDDRCYFNPKYTYLNKNYTVPFFVSNKTSSFGLNCFICEEDPSENPEAELSLKFHKKNHKLYLTIKSPEGLYKLNDMYALCMTDNYTAHQINKIEMKTIYEGQGHKQDYQINNIVYELSIQDLPAEYICYANQKPNSKVIESNKIIAYKKYKGYIYVVHISMYENIFDSFLYDSILAKETEMQVTSVKQIHVKNSEIYNAYLIRIITNKKYNIYSEFYKHERWTSEFASKNVTTKLHFFRSVDTCFPETTIIGNISIRWQIKQIGEIAFARNSCYLENGTPLTRKCIGTFSHGAYWDSVIGNCSEKYEKSNLTKLLEEYVIKNVTLEKNDIENLTNVVKTDLKSYDVYLLANLIETKFPENATEDYIEIVSNIMKTERNFLNESQITFNSTDMILYGFDTYLSNNIDQFLNYNSCYYLKQVENLIIHISYPFYCNVSGLAIYGNKNDSFENFKVTNLKRNDNESNIELENLQIATYVPNTVLENLVENLSIDDKNKIEVIVTIFFNDSLFNSANFSQKIEGSVISINIPQFDDYISKESIPLYFNSTFKGNCAFWDYGIDAMEVKSSTWSTVGNNYFEIINNTNIIHCSFIHLTHFALLITTERLIVTSDVDPTYIYVDDTHDNILSIITYICCGLSLIGLVGIFITALLFEKFRTKPGTKILLQISLAIIIEIIATQIAGMAVWYAKSSTTMCSIIGVVLHYIVLAKFSWMLVSAYLQYHRFVKVIGAPPQNLILKASIFGWIVPLIPVLLVYFLTPENYEAGKRNFCYPKNLSLYLGVFLPIIVIIIANMTIFSLVMHNIFHPRVKAKNSNSKGQKYQIYLAILLFFLLGIPWLFGVLAEIVQQSLMYYIFVYLFCLSATLQGFVLFIFYVLLDTDTRLLFKQRFLKSTFSNQARAHLKSTSEINNSKQFESRSENKYN